MSRPDRLGVLLLAQFYPPDIGGEERHVHNLARALVGRGHHVEVLTTALASTGAGTTDEEGVVVHRVRSGAQRLPGIYSDENRPHSPPVPDPGLRAATARLLDSGRFDVAHAHNWIVNSAIGPARRSGTPLVLSLHDFSHICAVKRFVRQGRICDGPSPLGCLRCGIGHYGLPLGTFTVGANAVSRRARHRGIASFIAVSSAVAEGSQLAGAGVPFEVIPNFVPDELLVTEAEPSDGPLLYLGDLVYDKGVTVVLDAYRRLEDPPELLLVGRRSPGLALDLPPGARVLPPAAHDEAMGHLRRARAVVVPSIVHDACPTVVLEAMAAGKPVVGAARGGIVDLVVDGATGFLVQPEPAAVADALRRLVEDPCLAHAMGRAGRERAVGFTASAVVERIEGVYAAVLAGRPDARPAAEALTP